MSREKEIIQAMEFIQENDVKFIRLQFCDLDGQNRNIAITVMQIERALTSGIPFDASLVVGFSESRNSDLVLCPDMSTIQILPWRPQQGKVARILCDIRYPDGEMYQEDSRYILKETMKALGKKGYDFYTSAECEFYLFKLDENGEPTTDPIDHAGYFDLAPFDRGENTRREICLTLEDMGFYIESSRHDSGKGQHEIDFQYDTALNSADNIMTFKTVVKTVAQRNGMHASFLPKPLMEEPGSGMHMNLILMRQGESIFDYKNGVLSEDAQHFIAGVLAHIKGITAIANPLINSYKRLMGGGSAPEYIGWGFSNRVPLIRIPGSDGAHSRIELRSPDPTCNPYLTSALILKAGLDGIEKELSLMEPISLEENTQIDCNKNYEALPMTLSEAIEAMSKDFLINEVLGERLTEKYIEIKKQEWKDYIKTVHPWEMKRYFANY